MAFQTIVVGANTYNSVGPGLYQRSTTVFGSPGSLFKISAGKVSSKEGPTTATVTRQLEVDVTTGTLVSRNKLSVSLQVQIPKGFTPLNITALIADIQGFCTEANLTRLLMGES